MPYEHNQITFDKIDKTIDLTITLSDDSIVFSNRLRQRLVCFRRFLVLKFLNKDSEEISISFQKNYNSNPTKLVLNRENKDFIYERKTHEIIKFDFDKFQDFIANNPFIGRFNLIDKRTKKTKHFATTELSNKFQNVVVSPYPKFVVDSETNTEELTAHYINSLKMSLRKLNDSEFLSVLNSAVALPQWCSDSKFSSIFKDELKRRHNSSSENT